MYKIHVIMTRDSPITKKNYEFPKENHRAEGILPWVQVSIRERFGPEAYSDAGGFYRVKSPAGCLLVKENSQILKENFA